MIKVVLTVWHTLLLRYTAVPWASEPLRRSSPSGEHRSTPGPAFLYSLQTPVHIKPYASVFKKVTRVNLNQGPFRPPTYIFSINSHWAIFWGRKEALTHALMVVQAASQNRRDKAWWQPKQQLRDKASFPALRRRTGLKQMWYFCYQTRICRATFQIWCIVARGSLQNPIESSSDKCIMAGKDIFIFNAAVNA